VNFTKGKISRTEPQKIVGRINNYKKMKNISKLFLITIFLFGVLYSCDNNSSELETQNNGPFSTTKLTDQNTKSKIQNYLIKNKINFKNNLFLKQNDIEFNMNDLYKVAFDGNEKSAIVANDISFNHNNKVNYGISFYQDAENMEIYKILIVKTEKVDSKINRIYYYDKDGTHLLTFQMNSETKNVDVTYIVDNTTNKGKLCSGSETASCLQDVYANHGWVSVWAFVQSAFIPETAAALAILCAYSC
jgi:hypothetical protein